ncbi:hypothetical protein [Allosalinactinospora lopnorensis]|uniref:hypothetical protein n=1 Tax=Allosalinactinospora lopnorensis TaxID=1352348 RepID=UPI000623CA78|nr:hypothetical protein [Allosalinactinospora lopnorensis]
MKPDRAVAGFDSATAMLRGLSYYLSGREFPFTGVVPKKAEPATIRFMRGANRLPRAAKEQTYAIAGWSEAIRRGEVKDVRSDDLASWVAGHYPDRQHEVAFIGSANGALTHLAAAVEAPWLPQTLLVPVRRHGVHPDDASQDLDKLRSTGLELAARNPEWNVHHMHDPAQDRLMVEYMAYFRVKWRRLPAPYRFFLRRRLAPGGTLVISDCGLRWPTTRVSDQYVFQHGALGGATKEEFHRGSERVREFLQSHGFPHEAWRGPEPDGDSPEAEWGFEPAILNDLRELAAEEGWNLVRLRYAEPESLSPAVADLYRDWYERRGLPTGRLLVESFMLTEPFWTLKTGSVPFWMVFNTENSLRALESYLDGAPDFEEIRLALFSHGVESVGLAPVQEWKRVLDRATKLGVFLGTDPDRFPRDFAVLAEAHRELTRIRRTYPLPESLPWATAADFLKARDDVDLIG